MAFISFKNLPKNTVKNFTGVEKKWEWNQSTERFEENDVDRQQEIDEYDGLDLKTMISKYNTIPTDETKKGVYMDTTMFGNFAQTRKAMEICDKYEFVEDNGDTSVEDTKENVPEKQDDVDEPKDDGQK